MAEEAGEGGVQAALALVGGERLPGRFLRPARQGGDQGGHRIGHGRAGIAQPGLDAFMDAVGVVLGRDAEMRAGECRQRGKRRRRVVALAEGVQDARIVGRLAGEEFMHQPRLAAAGIAHQHHAAAMPRRAAVQRRVQHRHLGAAADEGRLGAAGAELQARPARIDGDQAEHLHRFGRPAQVEHARRIGGDVAFHQPARGGGDPGLPRFGRLFDARGDVHHRAGGIEPGREVVGDVVDHHLARMHADSRGEVDAVARALLDADPAQRVAHVDRRAAGAEGVLFHRHRRAEHRHDAVADHAVDGAAIPMDRIDHGVHGGLEQFARALRVLVEDQPGRAADVGEQHRQRLAFLGADRRRGSQRLAAVVAEARARESGRRASGTPGSIFRSRHEDAIPHATEMKDRQSYDR